MSHPETTMEIHIELTAADVECLIEYVQNTSLIGIALLYCGYDILATDEPTNVIHCSEVDALLLLEIAKTHCPDAIERVRQGLRAAGVLVQD